MSDLAEFLLARINEDEKAARGQAELIDERYGEVNNEPAYEVDRGWWLQVSPARVLAECAAKRRIVELQEATDAAAQRKNAAEYYGSAHGLKAAMRCLALPYANHPDYREEWRP